jgi:hypothetical protein
MLLPDPLRRELLSTWVPVLVDGAARAIREGQSEPIVRHHVNLLMEQLDLEMIEVLSAVRAEFDEKLGALLAPRDTGGE